MDEYTLKLQKLCTPPWCICVTILVKVGPLVKLHRKYTIVGCITSAILELLHPSTWEIRIPTTRKQKKPTHFRLYLWNGRWRWAAPWD